jgi:hypothetical protein
VLDQEHDAVGVVAAIDAFAGRVQYFERRAGRGRKPLVAVNFADRDARADNRVAQLFHGRRQALEHHGRDINGANAESLQQSRNRIEVIGVGVRDDDRVEM